MRRRAGLPAPLAKRLAERKRPTRVSDKAKAERAKLQRARLLLHDAPINRRITIDGSEFIHTLDGVMPVSEAKKLGHIR